MERITELRPRQKQTKRPSAHSKKPLLTPQQQFSVLLKNHGDMIDGLIQRRFHNQPDFEDARQKVHMKIFLQLPKILQAKNIKGYLGALTVNQCATVKGERNALSRRGTTPLPEGAEHFIEHDLRLRRSPPNPLAALHHKEFSDAVLHSIGPRGNLTPIQRKLVQAVMERTQSGQPIDYEDLARKLGSTPGALKFQVFAARKKLEQDLGKKNAE